MKGDDELNTSTPMKKKKHQQQQQQPPKRTFLKRGEGLKRFQKGNNAYISKTKTKKKLANNTTGNNTKNSNNIKRHTNTTKKPVALTISAPPPSQASTLTALKKRVGVSGAGKTRPGLPLKLKLKKEVRAGSGGTQYEEEKTNGEDFMLDAKYISPVTSS